ncbi:hypothetical protein FPHYL_3476 [Fusarium phyllophilum]|uniref:Uncharacterized protein n=1 Tax=Fusarium phyllophilum TaxID=47803 RepID=A0A8H5K5G2_9HYPO|nr:hypothetical protein FPHYL_3476 [Fusarium phyllophilum]
MANPQDHAIIVIDDDDAPIPHPRAHAPQAPPRQGISIIEAIGQTGHVSGRPPMSILFGEGSLTRAELTLFIDLAQMMHEVEEGPNVPVGKLKVNHPPSIDFPGPPGPARLHGCPVYMSVSPVAQDQLLQPIWKDENGKFVSPRCVETDMPVGNCIDLAVLRFDRTATSRIKEYNIACITNAARRRLMHFAAHQSSNYLSSSETVLRRQQMPSRPCSTSVLAVGLVDVVRKPPVFTAGVRGGRRLATCELYRWRTNALFGVMWYTDGHTWWSSVTSSHIVDLEIAWGMNRLRHFDFQDFDNPIIAEGQYIAKCIEETCFHIHDLLNIL